MAVASYLMYRHESGFDSLIAPFARKQIHILFLKMLTISYSHNDCDAITAFTFTLLDWHILVKNSGFLHFSIAFSAQIKLQHQRKLLTMKL